MSKRLKLNLLLFTPILLTILLSGCSTEAENEGFINIEDQYAIKMHQVLSQNGGIPALEVSSLEPHECTNSYISHQILINDEKIQLFLNEIFTEGECIVGDEHIVENIAIETSDQNIPFEINLKDIITNKGSFQFSDSNYELFLENFDGLRILKTKILRINVDEIWGTFSTSSETVAAELRTELSALDKVVEHISGDHGYFYVAQDKSISVYADDANEGFLITSAVSVEELTEIVSELKQADPNLEFHATYFDGRVLNIQ